MRLQMKHRRLSKSETNNFVTTSNNSKNLYQSTELLIHTSKRMPNYVNFSISKLTDFYATLTQSQQSRIDFKSESTT